MDLVSVGLVNKLKDSLGNDMGNKLQAIASRGSHYVNGQSDAANPDASFKVSHIAATDCYDIALAYGNYYDEGWTPTNPITVKASLLIRGAYYPVYFNGATTAVIGEGGTVVSDPTGIFLAKGETFYSIVFVSAGTGGKYPRGLVMYSERGEGTASTDITAAGNPTSNGMFGYHPCAVLGRTLNPTPAVLLVGDSIMQGANDGWQDVGFAARALDAMGIPWIRVAKGGGSSYNFLNRSSMQRMRLAKYCTHAITNYGTNDLNGRTYAQLKGDLDTLWAMLASFDLKVIQCTITPHTSSTDAFKTEEAQTFNPSAAQVGPTGVRTQINEYIRKAPAPLIGYLEITDAVETARNSGKWKFPSYTVDGLHPSTAGHVAMANVLKATNLIK